MIKVENLTKTYGRTVAVDHVSFNVARGQIVGFLGPNGAGKTTTMRILSGFLPATGGTATIGGLDIFQDSVAVRRQIGYLPESAPLYTEMRVDEYLLFRGRLKGLRRQRLRERLDVVLSACNLKEQRRAIIGNLSKGFRQRVGLADSLIHEPPVLILDEPTIGLDPAQIRQIRQLIKSLGGVHTVLLSTHILSEVEMVCDQVVIINKGRIVAAETTSGLMALMRGSPQVVLEVVGPCDAVVAALQGVPGISKVAGTSSEGRCSITCECADGCDVRSEIFAAVAANGWVLRELRMERRNLEDVFVELVREG
jgi:ABC-2 type transport system ATP-binding protein